MNQTKAWKCEVCGYIHNGNQPPQICPVCGVGPELFKLFEIAQPKIEQQSDHHESSISFIEGSPANQILILGGGIAGLTAAEQIRMVSKNAKVTLVSKEAGLPYFRLNLTRFLAGEVTKESLLIQKQSWFDENKIELINGEATAIDRESKKVQLRDGTLLTYDRLILANGSHPFIPPFLGVARSGVFPFRTKDHVTAILSKAVKGSRCVCIGGGLLGLEAAGALSRRGVHVTVLEGYGWLLPRQLAEPAGKRLKKRLEAEGIEILCSVKVKEIVGDEDVRAVCLEDGKEIAADVVILATGVRPNSYLARQCGLDVKSGVIVNDQMLTSDPNILAAGDVAEHRGVVYGLWPASYAQGVVAGINADGGNVEFQGLPPSNRLKVLDVDLFSIGQIQPSDGSYQVFEYEEGEKYFRFVCRDGQLVGANLYGDTSLAPALQKYLENGTQIVEMHELIERFPMVDQPNLVLDC